MSDVTPKKNMIIAIPNASFAEGVKKHIERLGQYKVVEMVVVLEHLVEQLEMLNEEGKRIDAIFLSTDISKKLDDKRLELLSDTLLTIRERYSHIHFAILSNQRPGHPFLAELLNIGIYNIFIKEQGKNTLDLPAILNALENPIPFSEVSIFRDVDSTIPWRRFYKGGSAINVYLHRGGEDQEPGDMQAESQLKDVPPVARVIDGKGTAVNESGKEVVKESRKIETVVIEKEKWKEKVVEITISKYLAIPSKTISVVSLYPQVGSTFLIDNFTFYLAEKKIPVGVIEPPSHQSVWYELLDGDNKRPEGWVSWIKQIKDKGFVSKGSEWVENNVYYIPFGGEEVDEFSKDEALKLLYLTKQIPILFVDISDNLGNPMSEVALQQSDEIWVVISGDPIQINLRLERLMNFLKLIGADKNLIVIGNKWSNQLNEYLSPEIIHERTGLNLFTTIPDLTEITIPAMWSGKRLMEMKGGELIEKPFFTLAERLLPSEVTKGFKPKQGLFHLFKR
ncbi:hypothetical protein [Ammoniphilus resinae]|uniref:Flp pilus assembly CpaE family ATPase n=1 Tax=Ammoniphilus resinae TaxID=861532 RepID=A0ABS4GPM0_9BACL|nr:hypothetical protein [Ammoniphilus resinae]MBP1931810.1 Flp pilus assembly CpaE family ATPase [Ammoniphilus resinae]